MKKFKILIAEDNLLLLQALGSYMKIKGYDFSLASDGREAIKKIKENQYDLIITDINMPFNNGIEIISLVRNELKLKIPIIVLTVMGLESSELEAFNIGANEFITKPFSPKILGIRIEKILNGLPEEIQQEL